LENGDYLYIQTSETSYDYTLYGPDYKELDGGQLDNPDLSLAEAGKEILAAYELSAGQDNLIYRLPTMRKTLDFRGLLPP